MPGLNGSDDGGCCKLQPFTNQRQPGTSFSTSQRSTIITTVLSFLFVIQLHYFAVVMSTIVIATTIIKHLGEQSSLMG